MSSLFFFSFTRAWTKRRIQKKSIAGKVETKKLFSVYVIFYMDSISSVLPPSMSAVVSSSFPQNVMSCLDEKRTIGVTTNSATMALQSLTNTIPSTVFSVHTFPKPTMTQRGNGNDDDDDDDDGDDDDDDDGDDTGGNDDGKKKQKTITLESVMAKTKRKQVRQEKERKVRKRVQQWAFDQEDEECQRQHAIFLACFKETAVANDGSDATAEPSSMTVGRAGQEMTRQIREKIHGYRYQDQQKHIYDADAFVTFSDVMELLQSSHLRCYYCSRPVLLLYRYVRDGQQWSLERLDNRWGHNRTNVVVACLQCNLHRKTANSDSFVFSKQLRTIIRKSV